MQVLGDFRHSGTGFGGRRRVDSVRWMHREVPSRVRGVGRGTMRVQKGCRARARCQDVPMLYSRMHKGGEKGSGDHLSSAPSLSSELRRAGLLCGRLKTSKHSTQSFLPYTPVPQQQAFPFSLLSSLGPLLLPSPLGRPPPCFLVIAARAFSSSACCPQPKQPAHVARVELLFLPPHTSFLSTDRTPVRCTLSLDGITTLFSSFQQPSVRFAFLAP